MEWCGKGELSLPRYACLFMPTLVLSQLHRVPQIFSEPAKKKKCVCDWSTYSQPAKPIQDPVIAKRNKEKDRKRTMEGTVPHLFNPSIYVGKFPEFDV